MLSSVTYGTRRDEPTHPKHGDARPQDPVARELVQHGEGRVDLSLVAVRVRDDRHAGPRAAGHRREVEP